MKRETGPNALHQKDLRNKISRRRSHSSSRSRSPHHRAPSSKNRGTSRQSNISPRRESSHRSSSKRTTWSPSRRTSHGSPRRSTSHRSPQSKSSHHSMTSPDSRRSPSNRSRVRSPNRTPTRPSHKSDESHSPVRRSSPPHKKGSSHKSPSSSHRLKSKSRAEGKQSRSSPENKSSSPEFKTPQIKNRTKTLNVRLGESPERYKDKSRSRNVPTPSKKRGSPGSRSRSPDEQRKKGSSKTKHRKKSSSSSSLSSDEENVRLELSKVEKKIRKAKSKKKTAKKIKEQSVSVKNKRDLSNVEIKAEPPSTSEDPPVPLSPQLLQVKVEPGLDVRGREPQLHPSKPYFRPIVEVEKQPLLGLTKCRVCSTYYPEDEEKARAHLAQHGDRVFLVTLPRDTFYCDMEEAVQHLANFGIVKEELRKKVETCNLIKYPTNLKGFSCDICCTLDTNSEKDFNFHLKEECGRDISKEDRGKHLICFCRGCHTRFASKADLLLHVDMASPGSLRCWPGNMVLNRLYDQSSASKQVAVRPEQPSREKMVQVKQEKMVRAEQVRVKREMYEARQQHEMPQTPPAPRFDAFAPLTPQHQMYPPDPRQMSAPPPGLFLQQTYPMYPPSSRQMSIPPGLPSMSSLEQILQTAVGANQPLQAPSPLQYPFSSTPMLNPPPYPSFQEHHPPPPLDTSSGSVKSEHYLPPQPSPKVTSTADVASPAFSPHRSYTVSPPRSRQMSQSMSRDVLQHNRSREFSPPRSREVSQQRSRDVFRPKSREMSPPISHQRSREMSHQGSRDVSSSRDVGGMVVSPPNPATPLPNVDDLFSQKGRGDSAGHRPPQVPGVVSRDKVVRVDESVSIDEVEETPKTADKSSCRRSACSWTDPHAPDCSRLSILEKCSTGECRVEDKHRYWPPCPKYQFYCNCKRDSQGRYKYYDHLPQVVKISTKVPAGKRDDSVVEDKSVCMRLLYWVTSKELGDPRQHLVEYPLSENSPVKNCVSRGKGWGGNQLIYTWAGMSKIRVKRQINPHVLAETDEDDDITVCEQTTGVIDIF